MITRRQFLDFSKFIFRSGEESYKFKKMVESNSNIEAYILETFNNFKIKKKLENKFLRENAPKFKLRLEKLN